DLAPLKDAIVQQMGRNSTLTKPQVTSHGQSRSQRARYPQQQQHPTFQYQFQ
ncbi:hypothetical protein BGZ98_004406, partial [Dissophora globulifera]